MCSKKYRRILAVLTVVAAAMFCTSTEALAHELAWAKRAGGSSSDGGYGIAVDSFGNSYVTGYFRETATFGPGEANETDLTSEAFGDIFVAKYDTDGALLWAKQAGGPDSHDGGYAIAADGAGNSYVAGLFGETATFGSGEANETLLVSAGGWDIFVAKFFDETAIVVAIDIKPGSYPNSINLTSRGVVPVAILTTYDFDARNVEPNSVEFAGAEPVRWTLEDVYGDGILDMLFHFHTQDLILTNESTEATLTGETVDGIPIEGTDTVNIVPKGRSKKP